MLRSAAAVGDRALAFVRGDEAGEENMLYGLITLAVGAFLVFLALGGGGVLRLWAREPVGIAVPAFACLLVFGAPQMGDMLAGMRHGIGPDGLDDAPWHQTGLGVAVFFLALQSWFWMRAALNARGYAGGRTGWRDADMPSNLPWQQTAAPRLTLIPPTLIAISPIYQAWVGHIPWESVPWVGAGTAVAAAALVWGFAFVRRAFLNRALQGRAVAPPALVGSRLSRLFRAAPGGSRYAIALLAAAVVAMLLAQLVPDFVNDSLHAPTAALLALACLVATAAVLLAIIRDVVDAGLNRLNRWFGGGGHASVAAGDLIGLIALVLVPVGGSYLAQQVGLYDVRTEQSADAVSARPFVRDAVAQYLDCHDVHGSTPVPAIIVAAAGGASRSAAWTLSVLRMLDARTGGAVGAHLFAIVGVSGGSFGAVTYLMAQATTFPAADKTAPTTAEQVGFWSKTGPGNGLVELARADLLSSSAARMFASDALLGLPLRSPALEQAFEHHWRWDQGFNMPGLAPAGLLTLRQGRKCLAHVILNGTDVETGNRLLTSTIGFGVPAVVSNAANNINQPFSAAVDVLYSMNADVPSSAGVLNSARFPLISPPGTLHAAKGDEDRQVVDGGVFENLGARGAWELADAIRLADARITPIVLLISNEVELPAFPKSKDHKDDPEGRCASVTTEELNRRSLISAREARVRSGVSVPELLTSLIGLYNTRAGHARGEIAVLRQRYCRDPLPDLYHFDLPKPEVAKAQAAPMNWTLDVNTCQFLLGAARRATFNREQADQLRGRLTDFGVVTEPDYGDMAYEDSKRCKGDPRFLVEPWPALN